MIGKLLIALVLVQLALARPDARPNNHNDDKADTHMHSAAYNRPKRETKSTKISEEQTSTYWMQQAQQTLNAKLEAKLNTNIAKNVIMFLGDGMSIPTLFAARVYQGQLENKTGEESQLSFEKFPHTGLSKTYCVDKQVADSACSATAYLCGIKANEGTIGVNAQVPLGVCQAAMNNETHVTSIARWSQLKNKKTGLVTTTRVTHASPSGVFAATAHRDWESDRDLQKANVDPHKCRDIAYQLIHGETGKNLKVILGGGRVKFLPKSFEDPEGGYGERVDEVNLVDDWLQSKSSHAKYVWNRQGLLDVPEDTEHLMGLFESGHCKYHLETTKDEPSLSEMVEAAIKVLSRDNENGFFLFVEGGRIDHAHHDSLAHKALDETVEFSKAVRKAQDLVDDSDTLIVITSDHAHTMSISGYPQRGNPIFGLAGMADDKLPLATLNYANGRGYRAEVDGHRHNLNDDDMNDINYEFPGIAPLDSETHGGDDVGIFATGPWSHLFSGVLEQNVIPHLMAYASCVGDGITVCDSQ